MLVTDRPSEAYEWTTLHRAGGMVAFVPTMGALHDGHLSLVRYARRFATHVAVSIFVNPTQFAPTEDLTRYPRPLQNDLDMLEREGVSMVYTPSNESMYPSGYSTYVQPPAVAEPLEGVLRPGHFRGVCTVVLKLFQIVPANVAVFGQKDFQQSMVIQAMVRDFNLPIEIRLSETVREADGLAMSSRNAYLDPSQRSRAVSLSRALRSAKSLYDQGERQSVVLSDAMRAALRAGQPDGVDTIDYAVAVHRDTLREADVLSEPAVALVAARIGSTRLIDNFLL